MLPASLRLRLHPCPNTRLGTAGCGRAGAAFAREAGVRAGGNLPEVVTHRFAQGLGWASIGPMTRTGAV